MTDYAASRHYVHFRDVIRGTIDVCRPFGERVK